MQTTRYNYYEVLEIAANSPQHEVSTAYERARKTYSGDNPALYTVFSEKEARELLTVIEEAYQVLGNKILRNIYDQRLNNGHASLNDLTYSSILDASKQLLQLEEKKEKIANKTSYPRNAVFEKEMETWTNWDGSALKKVREYKQLTVHKVSEITKINSYYVSAIENMDVQGLPAIVFVRGYVVQIAKALGLNDKKVADSYMQNFKNGLGK
ncbi:MAG: helix-turn-helix domain-containing protein [Bdellovibrio sp.]